MTTASMSLPAVYAKKHHHLTDTEKEAGTASDSQGTPCNLGPSHDQCHDKFLESEGFAPPGKGKHFGECEDATQDAPLGSKCDIENN